MLSTLGAEAGGLQYEVLLDRSTKNEIEEYGRWFTKISMLGLRSVVCRDFELALVIADRLLAVFPTAASHNLLRAHALMFLNRPEEARTLYEQFRDSKTALDTRGIDTIRHEFAEMREAGLAHPLMDEIGKWG